MKKVISSVVLCASLGAQAAELPNQNITLDQQQYWITLGQDALPDLQKVGAKEFMTTSVVNQNSSEIAIAQINEGQLSTLSRLMHKNHNRCGGYIVHTSLQSALVEQQQSVVPSLFTASAFSEATTVNALLPNLAATNIVDTINYLSTNFNNRYYTTSGGTAASNGLRARWEGIVNGVSWANVTQVTHSGFAQKSVLVTLTGSEKPNEFVVVGGHLDSTIGSTSENSTAPGADDDASGIATLTEVMRVYVEAGVQPKRSVKFYAYAAEEVGLRGSKDIADTDKANNVDVKGVLQLDMTNYDGSVADIVLMQDYTNAAHNTYITNILNTYLPNISHSTDNCGYGCSDHASWTAAGYPASMPFETKMNQYNPKIHTSQDTLANMDSTAAKALKFAKMALAYVVEMAADTGGTTEPPTGDLVLVNGVAKTGVAVTTGNDVVYTMDVPAGATSINFAMSGGTGDADMYVKFGSTPTDSSYDCRPYAGGNNESCTGTSSGGTYYVRLKAYSGFTGVNLTGSYVEGGTGGLPTINETKTGVAVNSGAWVHYTQAVDAGYASFTVTMSGGTGDADLYVRKGAESTSSTYDCRPYKNGNSETCTLTSPPAGTIYIDVKGYTTASGVTLNWTAAE
jgi:leucyl aminopeptidase